ncbi:O-methyltransferase [Microbacterium sp. cx-55]|uniref:O-methyltransferase n=1 Tax=Microbacterium sp. cx-55 TaxID=2875948 RepID=UPI001CC19B29|nr:O-methyltransferase [Microbacterium sp. cx-55]MBZ4485820.1 O-methyltransferase [Microbacterium sp. cx-55]UGB34299.1 O-methyltransferase [Microbacterium sp. cx-55]
MSTPTPGPTIDSWRAVDAYLTRTLVVQDDALRAALSDQDAAGLPSIEVAPVHAKLLHLLARLIGARSILEIGTLGGYSTIWLARALPEGGRVTTIEADPANAVIARRNLDRAGVGDRVDVLVGRAADVLPGLTGPYDLVFIDADKESNTIYLDHAARLGRIGAAVIVDNVVRSGLVADPEVSSAQLKGVRRGLEMLRDDPRFDATAVQTLDAKGWDGIAVALRIEPAVPAVPTPPAH